MHLLKRGAFALGLFLCVAIPVHAETAAPDEVYRQTLLTLIERLQEQIVALQAAVDAHTHVRPQLEVPGSSANAVRFSDSVVVVARYAIEDDIVDQIPHPHHRRYLERVFALFPHSYRERLEEFIVFTDEDGYFDAFVETIPPQHDAWAYAVNQAVVEAADSTYTTELIVHELAHLVGYDEVPGTERPPNADCNEYFTQGWCPLGNSYLAHFTDRFWSEVDLERALRLRDETELIDAAEEHFTKNEDEYVTAYAATSPEEDFAESFMHFMLDESPKKGVAQTKVKFFADFVELRSMREEIRLRR